MSTAVASPVEAPAPTVGQIISGLQKRVSASRLNSFLQCRLKFWFHYVEGLTKSRTAALHVGTAVHSVLKAWNMARWKCQPLTLKGLHDEYSKAWADVGDEPIKWNDGEEAEEKATGWRIVETYIRESKIPESLKPDAVEVSVEADLNRHGLPNLIGVLDLVQSGIIVDYKTSGQTPNAERAVHTNEVQTSIYSLLYRDAKAKRENGIEVHTLVKLKTPKLVITASPPMTEQQQIRLFRQMEAYVHGLDMRDFVPSPGMQCASCQFFNECRRWS